MPLLMLKDLPRYECLLDAALQFPELDPSAVEAYLHLLRAGDDTYHLVEEYFTGHGLSPARFTLLMLLLDRPKITPVARTPAELADMAGVTRATMSGLIGTLEKDGLVERESDPEDGRMFRIRLTEKGHKTLKGILPGHYRRIANLMSPLSDSERKTLVRLLGKVTAQSVAMAGQPRTPSESPAAHAGAGASASAGAHVRS